MKTWVRILLGGVALVVVLVLVVFGIVRLTFDPGTYRARIDAAVSQAVGRPVTVRGPIHMSVLPWPGVRFRDVRVANAPGFGNQPMARIGSATVGLRLLPLAVGDVRFGTLTLDHAALRLTRRADGQSNWQRIVTRLSRAAPVEQRTRGQTRRSRDSASALPVSSLRVDAVEINDARIRYDDDRGDRHYRLSDADLETGRISNGHPFRLEARGALSWPGSDLVAAINVSSLIEPNVADRFYRFSGLSVHVLASGSAVPGGRQEASLGASGDIDLAAGRFGLDDVSLQSAGLTITGDTDGSGLNDTLSYHGRITVAAFNPRSVMQQFDMRQPETQSRSAFTDAGFDAQFEGGPRAVHFKQILARLDDSTLTGTVDVHDFAHPRYGFNLDLDTLDMDAYLPPGSAAQAETSEPAGTGGDADQKAAEFELAPLKRLRMRGQLSISSLTFAGLNVERSIADLSAAHDALKIQPLKADLYGGSVKMRGSVDAALKPPRYAVSGQIHGVALKPLLDDLLADDRLDGTGAAKIDLRARGRQIAQLKRSLRGTAYLLLTGTRIDGFDPGAMLAAARARADGQKAAAKSGSSSKSTVFRRIEGRFTIDRGIAQGDDLAWASARLSGRGQGRYSLPNNRLDYTLTVDVPGQVDGELAPMAGWRVPIHMTGPLLAPDDAVDIQAAVHAGDARQPIRGSQARGDKAATGDGHKSAR